MWELAESAEEDVAVLKKDCSERDLKACYIDQIPLWISKSEW